MLVVFPMNIDFLLKRIGLLGPPLTLLTFRKFLERCLQRNQVHFLLFSGCPPPHPGNLFFSVVFPRILSPPSPPLCSIPHVIGPSCECLKRPCFPFAACRFPHFPFHEFSMSLFLTNPFPLGHPFGNQAPPRNNLCRHSVFFDQARFLKRPFAPSR